MNSRKIITLPDKHLRQRSKKVGIINDRIRQIIREMQEVTLDWEDNRKHEVGVALASVQIDELLKIVVIRNNFDNKEDRTFSVYINPVITKYGGKIEEDYEGCLSVPDIYGKVPRHSTIRVEATDEKGNIFKIDADGFLARVFQHEVDHNNGIMFVDRIKNSMNAFYRLLPDGQLDSLDYEKDIRTNSILW